MPIVIGSCIICELFRMVDQNCCTIPPLKLERLSFKKLPGLLFRYTVNVLLVTGFEIYLYTLLQYYLIITISVLCASIKFVCYYLYNTFCIHWLKIMHKTIILRFIIISSCPMSYINKCITVFAVCAVINNIVSRAVVHSILLLLVFYGVLNRCKKKAGKKFSGLKININLFAALLKGSMVISNSNL
jgi:hypothetical protein